MLIGEIIILIQGLWPKHTWITTPVDKIVDEDEGPVCTNQLGLDHVCLCLGGRGGGMNGETVGQLSILFIVVICTEYTHPNYGKLVTRE